MGRRRQAEGMQGQGGREGVLVEKGGEKVGQGGKRGIVFGGDEAGGKELPPPRCHLSPALIY